MPTDFSALGDFAPATFVPPKDAEIHKDLQYSSQGHIRQRLDLYLPKPGARRSGATPLIIYVHGMYLVLSLDAAHPEAFN